MIDYLKKLLGIKPNSDIQSKKLVNAVATKNVVTNNKVTKSMSFMQSMVSGLDTAETAYSNELNVVNASIDALVAQREQLLHNLAEVRQFRTNIRVLTTTPVLQGNNKPTITVNTVN